MQIESRIYIYFTWGLSDIILKQLQLFIRALKELCGLWILLFLQCYLQLRSYPFEPPIMILKNPQIVISLQLLRDVWTWLISWTARLTLTGRSTTPRYWSPYWTGGPSLTSTPTPTTRTPGGATLWSTFPPSTISRSASVVSNNLINLCWNAFESYVLAFYTMSRG